MTAYLSLVFILLVSFTGSMIESASIQNAKNYGRADMNRAMESVFAEYQKELLEDYDIFALEGSYETGRYSEDLLKGRLGYYGAGSMEHKVRAIEFLTDQGGRAFYRQAAAYMEHKYGLSAFRGQEGDATLWRQQEQEAKKVQEQERQQQQELSDLLEQEEGALPEKDNPIAHVDKLKSSPLLDLVTPKEMTVSQKVIRLEETASHRSLQEGYGEFTQGEEETGALSDVLFGEYLMDHFSGATEGKDTGALDYELEYLRAG